MIEELTSENINEKIANGIVVVDFWGEHCRPCKAIEPYMVEIADKYNGVIRVYKFNAEKDPATASKWHIFSIPAVLIFKDGNLVDQIIGAYPKRKYYEIIEKAIE